MYDYQTICSMCTICPIGTICPIDQISSPTVRRRLILPDMIVRTFIFLFIGLTKDSDFAFISYLTHPQMEGHNNMNNSNFLQKAQTPNRKCFHWPRWLEGTIKGRAKKKNMAFYGIAFQEIPCFFNLTISYFSIPTSRSVTFYTVIIILFVCLFFPRLEGGSFF